MTAAAIPAAAEAATGTTAAAGAGAARAASTAARASKAPKARAPKKPAERATAGRKPAGKPSGQGQPARPTEDSSGPRPNRLRESAQRPGLLATPLKRIQYQREKTHVDIWRRGRRLLVAEFLVCAVITALSPLTDKHKQDSPVAIMKRSTGVAFLFILLALVASAGDGWARAAAALGGLVTVTLLVSERDLFAVIAARITSPDAIGAPAGPVVSLPNVPSSRGGVLEG